MKKLSAIVLIAVIIGVVWFFVYRNSNEIPSEPSVSPTPTTTPLPFPAPSPTPESVSKNVVSYSDSGYSPATLKIKKGSFVEFKNVGSNLMWTASAVHPTHKVYPGSGIEMCGTNTLVAIFDACQAYKAGELWEFKFDNQGIWKYHNHLQPSHFGTIIVE